jgi:hypothetical protein
LSFILASAALCYRSGMIAMDMTLVFALLSAVAAVGCFIGAAIQDKASNRNPTVTLTMAGALFVVSGLVIAGYL